MKSKPYTTKPCNLKPLDLKAPSRDTGVLEALQFYAV